LVKAVGGQKAWDELVAGKRNAVFTCGSGMTAAVGWLANEIIREKEGSKVKTSIYDEASRPPSKP
jgi:thiosulfate/3-mercaptopyruvate sulfurtransferase